METTRPPVLPPRRVEAEYVEPGLGAGGKNRAVLLACRDAAGEKVSCVVKLKARMSQESRGTYPVCNLLEWLAAAVGAELGICVPEPYVVEVGGTFVRFCDDDELRRHAAASQGNAFGSLYVQGAVPLPRGRDLKPEQRDPASRLLLFDVFIQNVDRRAVNANLFVTRDDYIAFDHGEAFTFLYAIGDVTLDPMLRMVGGHALFERLKGKRLDPQGFLSALESLTDERLDAIGAATPAAWQGGDDEGKLLKALDVLKQRRDGVLQWLPQVIAALG